MMKPKRLQLIVTENNPPLVLQKQGFDLDEMQNSDSHKIICSLAIIPGSFPHQRTSFLVNISFFSAREHLKTGRGQARSYLIQQCNCRLFNKKRIEDVT